MAISQRLIRERLCSLWITPQIILWDGNHRISCIENMKSGFPEYVPVDFVRINLDSIEGIDGILHKVPTMPKEWPTYPCGYHFGFNTNIVK